MVDSGMATILDDLRRAVETSNETRYRIAKDSGINASQLSRLVRGERGLNLETAERLADYLGLEIIVRPKRRARKVK